MEERAPYMTAIAERDPEREHLVEERRALLAEIAALDVTKQARKMKLACLERRLGLDTRREKR